MEPNHCPEELEVLKLLKELQTILAEALDSLAGLTPSSLEARYVSDAAMSVNFAADAYRLLREAGRVHASKLMIRPMIEAVITATAVVTKKGFLFRKAFTEFSEMEKLYEKTPANVATAKAKLEQLKKQFRKEPNYPIECKKVDARYTAEVAGLVLLYDSAYRIYCEFTHNAVRAIRGSLNETTDPVDTTMVILALGVMLNQLKQLTPAKVPDLTPFNERIERAQQAILAAWGHEVPNPQT
jgi:hypothetical protein